MWVPEPRFYSLEDPVIARPIHPKQDVAFIAISCRKMHQ